MKSIAVLALLSVTNAQDEAAWDPSMQGGAAE